MPDQTPQTQVGPLRQLLREHAAQGFPLIRRFLLTELLPIGIQFLDAATPVVAAANPVAGLALSAAKPILTGIQLAAQQNQASKS